MIKRRSRWNRQLITRLNAGILLGIGCLLLISASVGWAWDGDWTNASSGKPYGLLQDSEDSHGKAGTDPPQKYWTPDPRDEADVDPDELSDYFDRYKKEYAPYALARVTQNLHYNQLTIPKGYYLIKPDDENAGSQRVNLNTLTTPKPQIGDENVETLPPLETEAQQVYGSTSKPMSAPPATTAAAPAPSVKADAPIYQTFVILKLGKVIGVVPVHRMERYHPQKKQGSNKKEKLPKQAIAWVAMENHRPVLKYYYKKWIYTTEFQ